MPCKKAEQLQQTKSEHVKATPYAKGHSSSRHRRGKDFKERNPAAPKACLLSGSPSVGACCTLARCLVRPVSHRSSKYSFTSFNTNRGTIAGASSVSATSTYTSTIFRLFFISRVTKPFRTFRRAIEALAMEAIYDCQNSGLQRPIRGLQLLPWEELLPTIWPAQFATPWKHCTSGYKERTARKQSF
jgi:hypothetical protein